VEIGKLAVRDDELDVGDNEVTSSDVAEGGTAREGRGKSRGWTREHLPLMGVMTLHVEGRNRTSEGLGIVGYSWIVRIPGTTVGREPSISYIDLSLNTV
jgi:hypothetical protein